jgi:hypothetical protein
MPTRPSSRPLRGAAAFNWLEELDRRVRELPPGSDWLEDSVLAPQRCRRFLMARFPELSRPFPDPVLLGELSRGERLITDSEHAHRILDGLNPKQRGELAGLILDITEALDAYTRHLRSARIAQGLFGSAERRMRMLSRKVSKIRSDLKRLQQYAAALNPLLGMEYSHAAQRCLAILEKLKNDTSAGEFCRSFRSEYPTVENPWHLGLVELYWFYRHECRRSGHESEVRTAIIANEVLPNPRSRKLTYISKYRDAESQGCSAVRLSVSRYQPRTME